MKKRVADIIMDTLVEYGITDCGSRGRSDAPGSCTAGMQSDEKVF